MHETEAYECRCDARLTHKPPNCASCRQLSTTRAQERSKAAKRASRASMTESDRLAELARSKRRHSRLDGDGVVDAVRSHVQNLPEIEARTLAKSSERLSTMATKELVCCVCDCLHPALEVKTVNIDASPALMEAMKARLRAPPNLPDCILQQYDASDMYSPFRGILLSRSGICRFGHHVFVRVCVSCKTSLMDKKRVHPPKFAVANGLYMGCLPISFGDSTFTENAMLNLAQPMHFLSVVRGGKHTSLRSHVYFFRADPAPPAQLLPRDVVSEGSIGVTIVGAMTSSQKAATLRKYDVRVGRLREQLSWYQQNNRLYAHVASSPDWEAVVTAMRTRVVLDISEATVDVDSLVEDAVPSERIRAHLTGEAFGALSDPPSCGDSNQMHQGAGTLYSSSDNYNQMLSSSNDVAFAPDLACGDELDRATWRHNAPAPAHLTVSEQDEACEQISVGLISDFCHVGESTGIQHVLNKKSAVVYRSSDILSDFDAAFWVNAFSELFPFGRGGLDEPRSVPIGLLEFVKYCLRLSHRRHAQHRSFHLVAFDVIARHNALQAIYIKARASPGSMERAAKISRESLQRYLSYQQDRLQALSQSAPVPERPAIDGHVAELFSSISTGLRAFWGSNEERAKARADIFSMQLQFGQPTLFFTLSPDSSTTYRIGNLAGAIHDDVLAEMETNVQECLVYSRAKLGQIAASNPFVCAKYFDYLMSVFVEVVLNWDASQACSRAEPGIFGRTKAYFAATESQNSTGSLHSHMLIWIDKMPSTVQEYYTLCSSQTFRSTMIEYVDSIAASSVPLDTASCLSCDKGSMVGLPFEQKAFRKSRPGALRPPTMSCLQCGVSYGADESIKKHAEQIEGATKGLSRCDTDVFWRIAVSRPLPLARCSTSIDAVITARSLLYYQHHATPQ